MKGQVPRIAFFPDAFHEIDGVAVVARQFEAFARQHDFPFLIVHAGPSDNVVREGSVIRVQLKRGPMKFPLDRSHEFDLLFSRHYRKVESALHEFQPDLIQITGPSDVGILGALFAHNKRIPLAAFWQTNLPEYAGRRTAHTLSFLPKSLAASAAKMAERGSVLVTTRYYKIPALLFAPNPEIVTELAKATGKPCLPMAHGVDTTVFDPKFRNRHGGPFTIGYVGRLTAEKNVRWLARLEKDLLVQGHRDFRLLVVGQGAEEPWLRSNLRHAEFTGALRGAALARAYANMDVLAFPSETETFGLVVLEALASGVPAVVTSVGGPKYTVQHGKTGYVARCYEEFLDFVAVLIGAPDTLATMRMAARKYAQSASWEKAFQEIYKGYADHLDLPPVAGTKYQCINA